MQNVFRYVELPHNEMHFAHNGYVENVFHHVQNVFRYVGNLFRYVQNIIRHVHTMYIHLLCH